MVFNPSYLHLPKKNKFLVSYIVLRAGCTFFGEVDMKTKKRKPYNNMLDVELIKSLKILAVRQDKRQNDLLEEAIRDLLKKYRKKVPQK